MLYYARYYFYCRNVGAVIPITPILWKAFNNSLYANEYEQIILWNIRNDAENPDLSGTVLQIVHE